MTQPATLATDSRMPAVSIPAYRPVLGVAWMMLAVASFMLMGIAGREIAGQHDVFELILFRAILGLGVVLALILPRQGPAGISTAFVPVHMLRCAIQFCGQALWFLALALIPLGQVFALEFTTPIWLLLLAPFFLGERLTGPRVLACLAGFAGVLIVARPDFGNISPGILAGITCAVFFAMNLVIVKKLAGREGVMSILFWQCALQMVLGTVVVFQDGQVRLPTADSWIWLVVIGITGLTAQGGLVKSMQYAPASFVVSFDYIRLPLALAAGALIYGEPIETAVVVGAGLIVLGNWINIRYGAK